MDADGVDADESVDKPQKRRVVELSSPAASIVFEYNPETKPSVGPFAGRLRLPAAPKSFGFDLAPYARAAGVDVEAAVAAFFVVLSFWRAMAASVTRRARRRRVLRRETRHRVRRHRRGDGGDDDPRARPAGVHVRRAGGSFASAADDADVD